MRRIVYRLAGASINIGQTLSIPDKSDAAPIDATGLPIFAQITPSGSHKRFPWIAKRARPWTGPPSSA